MPYYLTEDSFQSLLSNNTLTRLDKLLLILFWDTETLKSVSDIKSLGIANGLREITKWNVSDTLSKSKGSAVNLHGKWSVTGSGKSHLSSSGYIQNKPTYLKNDISDLQQYLLRISDSNTQSFIQEAITCLETDQRRAAVVLSWIGAVSVLYDEVVKSHLAAFNTEAQRRDIKWKTAKTADDLSQMKEFDFLTVLESISVIGKNVKTELQNCLQLRNGCGHPNSLKIGVRKVASHLEILILNVFAKF